MAYLPVAQAAARIRAEYKKRGWSSKQISVRSESYSMGSSIRVKILDPFIPIAVVEEIADEEQHIDRCQFSGEILSGGNRYVFVGYDGPAYDAHIASIAAQIPTDGSQAEVLGYTVWRDADRHQEYHGHFHDAPDNADYRWVSTAGCWGTEALAAWIHKGLQRLVCGECGSRLSDLGAHGFGCAVCADKELVEHNDKKLRGPALRQHLASKYALLLV